MPIFKGRFLSIIFIGGLNPQILNHDFLLNNGIIPKDQEPFKEFLIGDGKSFTDFISTPPFASIKYGPISITVDEKSYQIVDARFKNKPSNMIIEITKKYFGEILKFTPLRVGGINLNGIIQFNDAQDEQKFDALLGITKKNLTEISNTDDVRVGIEFTFPWKNGMIAVQVSKPRDRKKPGKLQLNYEFWDKNLDVLLKNLDDFDQLYTKFIDLLHSWSVEIKT